MDYVDYYATLGVDKKANAEEIQKAYRRLARKYHPDINKTPEGEARFKEINEAYQVLSDTDKRARYDQFGSAWKNAQTTGTPPPGFEDIFSQFGFGGAGGGFRARKSRRSGAGGSGFSSFFEALFGSEGPGFGGWTTVEDFAQRGVDQEATLTVSLRDAIRGTERSITLSDGRGGSKRLKVKVPAGVRSGQRIRLAGQGGAGRGSRGDLLLKVEVAPENGFQLDGKDIHTTLRLAPWEAALGGEVDLKTLTGTRRIRVPPGTSSGRKIRLRGHGYPDSRSGAGDLIAKVSVVVPGELSEKQKKLFEQLAAESDFQPREQ